MGRMECHARLWNTWIPENETSGKRLPRRVKKRLSFDLRRDIGRFSIGGRLLAEGDRFDNAGNTVRVNGFTLRLICQESTVSVNA